MSSVDKSRGWQLISESPLHELGAQVLSNSFYLICPIDLKKINGKELFHRGQMLVAYLFRLP